MTFLEALEEAKKGKKVRHDLWSSEIYLVIENGNIKMCNTQYNFLTKGDYTSNYWEIYKEKILTDEEKEYLNNVIKPFKNKVSYILKYKKLCPGESEEEYIQICIRSYDNRYEYIKLPYFIRGSMYNNMQLGYQYSIEELDL